MNPMDRLPCSTPPGDQSLFRTNGWWRRYDDLSDSGISVGGPQRNKLQGLAGGRASMERPTSLRGVLQICSDRSPSPCCPPSSRLRSHWLWLCVSCVLNSTKLWCRPLTCCLLPAALRRKSLDRDNDPVMEEMPGRRSFAAAPPKRTSGAFPAAAARLRQSLDRSRSSLDARRDSLQVQQGNRLLRGAEAYMAVQRSAACSTRSASLCIRAPASSMQTVDAVLLKFARQCFLIYLQPARQWFSTHRFCAVSTLP